MYRSLVSVIQTAFSEPISQWFHFTPFKRIWKLLQFHRNGYFSLTIVFPFTSTLADTLCSMDVSCSPDPVTSHFCITCHRLVYSYVSLPPYVFLTCTVMDSRLVSGYSFVFRFSFYVVDSSTYVSRLRLSPFVLSTRLCLPIPLMLFLL